MHLLVFGLCIYYFGVKIYSVKEQYQRLFFLNSSLYSQIPQNFSNSWHFGWFRHLSTLRAFVFHDFWNGSECDLAEWLQCKLFLWLSVVIASNHQIVIAVVFTFHRLSHHGSYDACLSLFHFFGGFGFFDSLNVIVRIDLKARNHLNYVVKETTQLNTSMLSISLAPSWLELTVIFDSWHNESRFLLLRYFAKNFRTWDSVLVPSNSAIACQDYFLVFSYVQRLLEFTLKLCPYFRKPMIASEHSSFVHRGKMRVRATSSRSFTSWASPLHDFRELIFCLFFWIFFENN